MIARDEQTSLEIVIPAAGARFQSSQRREVPDRATLERAAFVRHHVGEILKKSKTSAAHRTKGKKLLQKCEAVGDTAAGDEARAEYLMAERADALAEGHVRALIERTAIDG
jgi:hypothetical protein